MNGAIFEFSVSPRRKPLPLEPNGSRGGLAEHGCGEKAAATRHTASFSLSAGVGATVSSVGPSWVIATVCSK